MMSTFGLKLIGLGHVLSLLHHDHQVAQQCSSKDAFEDTNWDQRTDDLEYEEHYEETQGW